MARVIVAGVLAGWCAVTSLSADVYYLKNGGKVEGRGEDQGSSIVVHLPLGSIRIDKGEIDRVVSRPSILDLYADKLSATPRTAPARYDLATWCEAAGLRKQSNAHLGEVLAVDPDHAGARARLGHTRVGARWLTADELHEFNGEISFRGRWMSPQTVASILQAEALQLRLAAPGGPGGAGAAPVGAPAGGGAGVGAGGQPIGGGPGNAAGVPPGKPAPLQLARSIRPSQEFLDKYFVTNPFMYGSAGARIHQGAAYAGTETAGVITQGPIYYGPYLYDGWDGPVERVAGFGVVGGSIAGIGGSTSGSGTPRGGLGFGYSFGRPSDRFYHSGALGAGLSSGPGGSSEHFGHGFFGHFRQGDHSLRYQFR